MSLPHARNTDSLDPHSSERNDAGLSMQADSSTEPARRRSLTKKAGSSSRVPLVLQSNRLKIGGVKGTAVPDAADSRPDFGADRLLNEPSGTIGHQDVNAARVIAARRIAALGIAARSDLHGL